VSTRLYGERWEIVKSLDEGGQGLIFLVHDTKENHDSQFVLKRLKNFNRLGRFESEIKACQHLNHPGIAPIIDYSVDDPAFFVTKFYDGKTLSESTPFSPIDALNLFIELCKIVDYAHSKGIVHRDLKPDNIYITPSREIVLLDFGLCYVINEDQRLTGTMEQVGSRFYMAPELESGRKE
jgi:serine/threonine protein kinase